MIRVADAQVARIRRSLTARLPRGDAGTSLMELIVGMAIMVVFMTMFTGAMLLMTNTTNKVQVVSDTTNQATYTFVRLDRQVRYATAITNLGTQSSSMWHVEYATNNIVRSGTNAITTSTQCTQLAVAPPPAGSSSSNGVFETRSWTVNNTSGATSGLTGWTILANNVTNYGSSASPFPTTSSIAGSNASSSMQQLTLNLVLAPVSPATISTTSTYTFTALNSSTSNTTPVCQQFAVGS